MRGARRVLLAAVGSCAGAVTGGLMGAAWYIAFGPPWGQYGYVFEGLTETAHGAVVGALVGARATGLAARARRGRDRPGRGN